MSEYKSREKCLFDTSSRMFWALYERYKPDAVLAMVSGGNDSRAMFGVAEWIMKDVSDCTHLI